MKAIPIKASVADERFAFGKNWLRFLRVVNEERIAAAEKSLQKLLGITDLNGKRFLDAGCGSGLFSLAALRLGADVHSFDYDADAVACARELKKRYEFANNRWTIEQGSVVDGSFLDRLGTFDVVYSWGVLHHTGNLWKALENVHPLVKPNGLLCVAIYNDQRRISDLWLRIKRLYNRSPKPVKFFIVVSIGALFEIRSALIRLTKLQNPLPFKDWTTLNRRRGISVWYDLVDWVGGYPFEVASPEEIFEFYFKRSFTLTALKTCGGGLGCNEFVFKKDQ